MKEQIIELLKKSDKNLTVQDSYDALGLKKVEELKDLLKDLDSLEKEMLISKRCLAWGSCRW